MYTLRYFIEYTAVSLVVLQLLLIVIDILEARRRKPTNTGEGQR